MVSCEAQEFKKKKKKGRKGCASAGSYCPKTTGNSWAYSKKKGTVKK